jgi:hypothetical protein
VQLRSKRHLVKLILVLCLKVTLQIANCVDALLRGRGIPSLGRSRRHAQVSVGAAQHVAVSARGHETWLAAAALGVC